MDAEPLIESHPVDLVDAAGAVLPATVSVIEGYDDYRVQLQWAGRELSATQADAFSALCVLREQLAAFGLTPRCYGACRNLVVSGMAVDMGGGLSGYLVRLGHHARMADLVPIFDAGPDMELASVADQQEFTQLWLNS